MQGNNSQFLARNAGKVIAIYDQVSPSSHKIQTTLDEDDVKFILEMRSDPELQKKVLLVYEADGSK